ncbi:alpha-ketoglutarate decarboxylase [Flavobacteriaceae bacterium XHP0103]|uniref:alpha-ketoglutarate decarboxylase n=1 Tax=Marixanthotalea marina TaxID=2844359 RepID=UPI00298A013E|nr:alpha-ketoglutarate decarboxylase [Marixanthotalea marina]MBU3822193.1 alpha-ketoglutarate decarboxylase [Marixanthotalea marina]
MNQIITIQKKGLLIFLLFFGFHNLILSQQKPNDFWSHVRFGGGIGLSFGDGFFSGTLAPSAIYQFNSAVALGVGLNGTINNRKDFYKSTIIGGSLIGLFNVIPQIQLSAEFEELNVNRKFDDRLNLQDDNYWYPALFMGAGYRSGNVAFGIRYDVLYDKDRSIYADPWAPFIRFYF